MTNESRDNTMDKNDLNALKKASKQHVIPSVKARLEEGETAWLRGRPVEADKDLISIEMSNNIVITIAESDILECAQHEDQYFIRVKRGTNTVTRLETTLSIDPRRPEKPCDCGKTGETTTRFRPRQSFGVGFVGGLSTLDPDSCVICEWVWVQSVCSLPGFDFKVVCLELELVCTNICMPA